MDKWRYFVAAFADIVAVVAVADVVVVVVAVEVVAAGTVPTVVVEVANLEYLQSHLEVVLCFQCDISDQYFFQFQSTASHAIVCSSQLIAHDRIHGRARVCVRVHGSDRVLFERLVQLP